MSDTNHTRSHEAITLRVPNCLEIARNRRYCGGAEEAHAKIIELETRLDVAEKEIGRVNEVRDSWYESARQLKERAIKAESRLDRALEVLRSGVAMLDRFERIGYVHNEQTQAWNRAASAVIDSGVVEKSPVRCYRCHSEYDTQPLRCVVANCGGVVFEPVVERHTHLFGDDGRCECGVHALD